ncbi:riboflavin synthase [Eubacterium sp. 1001713B170207_170306_E7]|uniref:riboflavin synthase n=1 Tax=Eubacterium sp. 1001713B170207_170306_E7 TaxID=2787097 RepID=UPI00189A8D95|nr:riboflavin synthase [Eubacterium sp. 1001713B170207_170306_E7]
MFTGIIEEMGTIQSIRRGAASSVMTLEAGIVLEDTQEGDSIAVNGVCLTITDFSSSDFTVDIMHETLTRSSLSTLRPGDVVNLERAMAANGRFGGHIVSGHIDGTGKITDVKKDDNAVWYTIQTSSGLSRYIVEKGSIAVDGISLTVASVKGNLFSVSVIPHTVKKTILSQKGVGACVNLENDCIGKYVEKLFGTAPHQSGITKDFIKKFGY